MSDSVKVVFDTNVLISATLSDGPPYQLLERAEAGNIRSVTSPGIIEETRDVLNRDRIPFSEDRIDEFVEKMLSVSLVVDPDIHLEVVDDDPDDDKIVECAVAADADYLVSGDRHLRELGSHDGIPVVPPADFLEKIDE
ncbi:MAG: putative toxin-antitoxin system toxin component, PIN family [Halanaeroarchaeum sp.]